MTRIYVGELHEIRETGRRLVQQGEHRIAVFWHEEQFIAIDNHCSHRGGPVGAGPLEQGVLVCPWHGWKFDLATQRCIEGGTASLQQYQVEIESEKLYVRPVTVSEQETATTRLLIRYSLWNRVGWFSAESTLPRGTMVIVQTPRGQEQGTVMSTETIAATSTTGQVLESAERSTDPVDDCRSRVAEIIAQAEEQLRQEQAAVSVVDAELLWDQEHLIIYCLGDVTATLGPIAVRLSECFNLDIRFEAMSENDFGDAAQATPAGGTSEVMKGPYQRLKHDIRRVWECPQCQHRVRTPGSVTSMICNCQADVPFLERQPMKLVVDPPGGIKSLPDAEAN